MKLLHLCGVFAFTLLLGAAAQAVTVSCNENGIRVETGPTSARTLKYPTLLDANRKKVHPLLEKHVDANKAVLKYDGGTTITVTVADGGKANLTWTRLPEDVKFLTVSSLLGFSYSQGGTYDADRQGARPFPAEKPPKPHLVQGHVRTLQLVSPEGEYFTVNFPPYCYVELTDNREWDWKTFELKATWPINRDRPTEALVFPDAPQQEGAAKQSVSPIKVDRFGQNARVDFPGKIKDEDELKADVEADEAYYASLNPPARDRFGGLLDSGAQLGLKKTGFFHVEQAGEGEHRRWYMVDPDGNAFFHLGICSFNSGFNSTYVEGREQVYAWLPPREEPWLGAFHPQHRGWVSFAAVNWIRKFGKPFDEDEFCLRMIERVRKFGFNSGGAFGGPTRAARAQAGFPYVSSLPLSQYQGIPRIPGVREAFDPYDPKVRERIDKNFAKLADLASDPLMIGYFIANEPLYEDVPRVVPTLKGNWAAKQRLAEMLRAKYPDVNAFNSAWNANLTSMDALADTPLAVTTQAAADDMHAYMDDYYETLFALLRDTLRKYDPNHMLLGCRLQSGTINNEQLCRIASKYLDVFTYNYYTLSVDRALLSRIHGWTGLPMILSEFYFDSPSDSGLSGGVKDVSSQQERGLAYRNYIEQSASLPFIVGAEWYTLQDASTTGVAYAKYHGENPNSGLFSVVDRPWKPMIAEMIKTNYEIYAVMQRQREPFALQDPRFAVKTGAARSVNIPRAVGPVALDGTAAGFPGIPAEVIGPDSMVIGRDAGGMQTAFKLCWDDTYLYILANVTDPTPMQNKARGDGLWSGDGIELFFGPQELQHGGPLLFSDRHLFLSGGLIDGQPNWYLMRAQQQPDIKMVVIPDVGGGGYTIQAAIPFAALGFTPTEGQEIRFDLAVDDSANGTRRDRQFAWNGTANNSVDRTAWGRAVFGR